MTTPPSVRVETPPGRLPQASNPPRDDRLPEASPGPERRRRTQSRWLWAASVLVLVPVAGIAAALSFSSLYEAATPIFGFRRAFGFPLLVDMLILGTSLAYLAGAIHGRARVGWRWTAHGGVAGTLWLNCLAAGSPGRIAWHVTAPAVWSVLVEMTARQVTASNRAAQPLVDQPVPARLWLSAPREAARIWSHMIRRGEPRYQEAATAVATQAAATQALKVALPDSSAWEVRRTVRRHLRAGSLTPAAVLDAVGWQATGQHVKEPAPADVLRAVLTMILDDTTSRPRERRNRPHGVDTAAVNHPKPRPPANQNVARHAAAVEIVQARPMISSAELARELTAANWPVSKRTAARILAAFRDSTLSSTSTPTEVS